MADLDLRAVMARYSRALDAKPSKGEITADGIAWITDSVADVPQMLAEIERLAAWKASALTVMDGLQELGQALRVPLGERVTGPSALAEVQRLKAQNTRYAQQIANASTSMQELLDVALVDVKANIDGLLGRLLALVSDWQANGNSRELGDPTADVWQAWARQLLDTLNPPVPDWERELLSPNPPEPDPDRQTIRVHGVTFACSCGFRDQAGALSIYNHACSHDGAYVTDPHGTVWVDQSHHVEGDSIIGPGAAGVDHG